MDGGAIGWIGAVSGTLIGLLGGAIGTYFSVINTTNAAERAFMVKCAVATWMGVIAFLALMFILPSPYNVWLWIPYGIALPLAIRYANRRQVALRGGEKADCVSDQR